MLKKDSFTVTVCYKGSDGAGYLRPDGSFSTVSADVNMLVINPVALCFDDIPPNTQPYTSSGANSNNKTNVLFLPKI